MHLKKKDWSIEEISRQINSIARECSSPYNDGFTAFGLKQDLHTLKAVIDEALSKSPTFFGEDEWLKEQEQKRIINILKS